MGGVWRWGAAEESDTQRMAGLCKSELGDGYVPFQVASGDCAEQS